MSGSSNEVYLQEFQQRAKANNAESGPASTSGRADGLSVEDSWDISDDYTPFPSSVPAFPSDALKAGQWAIGSNYNMAASTELWNRVSQVNHLLHYTLK